MDYNSPYRHMLGFVNGCSIGPSICSSFPIGWRAWEQSKGPIEQLSVCHLKKAQPRKKTVQVSEVIMFQLVKKKCSEKLFNHYSQVTPQSTNKAYNVFTHITYQPRSSHITINLEITDLQGKNNILTYWINLHWSILLWV